MRYLIWNHIACDKEPSVIESFIRLRDTVGTVCLDLTTANDSLSVDRYNFTCNTQVPSLCLPLRSSSYWFMFWSVIFVVFFISTQQSRASGGRNSSGSPPWTFPYPPRTPTNHQESVIQQKLLRFRNWDPSPVSHQWINRVDTVWTVCLDLTKTDQQPMTAYLWTDTILHVTLKFQFVIFLCF